MDAFSGVLSNPLSLNRYAYAGDNPMTFSDNAGHDYTNTCTVNWNCPSNKLIVTRGNGIPFLPPWKWSTAQWESFGFFAGAAVGAELASAYFPPLAIPLWGATAGAFLGMTPHGGQDPAETLAGATSAGLTAAGLRGAFPESIMDGLSSEASFGVKSLASAVLGVAGGAFSALLTGDASSFLDTMLVPGIVGGVVTAAMSSEPEATFLAVGIALYLYMLYRSAQPQGQFASQETTTTISTTTTRLIP